MKQHSKILFAFLLMASLVSCRKSGQFSDIPSLEYKRYSFESEPGTNRQNYVLTVAFTDGDGDIGILEGSQIDSCNLSDYNFLIRYFEKINGAYAEIPAADSCLPFHNIIPDITPEGQNKILEGDIIAKFPYSGLPLFNTDSIRFEFVLIDRAGHRSAPVKSERIGLEQ
jgi:hypothetical protein